VSAVELVVTPPHSDEAEHAVLGSVLLDNAQIEAVSAVLSAEDWYVPAHRAMWATITTLGAAGKVADVVTVADAGGHDMAYLNSMANSVHTARHAAAYAQIVRQCAIRREVVRLCGDLADDAVRGSGDCGPSIEQTVAKLLALQAGQASRSPRKIGVLLPEFLARLEERAEGANDAAPTGLQALDRLLSGGLREGELMVIGARPSMGKSALALTLARNMARSGPVLVCSMEDSDQMLVARQVAAAGRVNLADIRNPAKAPDSMWSGVLSGADDLKDLDLYIDDEPSLKLSDVTRKIGEVRRQAGPLRAVVVDYVQLMEGDGDNRHQVLSAIAAGMKKAAKDYRVPIVLLSQLTREADKLNGPPRLEHLRESGGIEEAADMVGLLWREHRRKPTADNKHQAQVELAKHKNGPTDTVRLWFDGATQRFEDALSDGYGGDA